MTKARGTASRRLRSSFLPGVGLLALIGCSVPTPVEVNGFAVHTEGMADAFDRTYQETLKLLDEAPVTPELVEVHERLLEEEEALEHSFGPIRQSLDAATRYAASLQSLIHDRSMPAADAAAQLQDGVRNMLGPLGALAPPLEGGAVVSEIGKAVAEINDIRRIRKANRTLSRAMKTLRPAIRHYVAEVRADLNDLHDWTQRVVDLLQEQNQHIHADALTVASSDAAREKATLHALALIATLDVTQVGNLKPHPLILQPPTGKARQKALRDPMAPLRAAGLRGDLEHIQRSKQEAVEVAGLDASLVRLEGALRARKVLLQALARKKIASPETEATDATVSARIDALLRRLEERVSAPGAVLGGADSGGERLAPDLDEAGTAVLYLVKELFLVLAGDASRARRQGRCGDVAFLAELALAGRGLDAALRGARGAEQLLGHQLATTLAKLFDDEAHAVLRDLRGETAWLRLLATVRPGGRPPSPLPGGLSDACRQGVGGPLTPEAVRDHLKVLWLTRAGTAELGVRALEVSDALDDMVRTAGPAGHLDPGSVAPMLLAADAAVSRLWEAAGAVGSLAEVDAVVSENPLPNARLLEQRETYWRGRIEEVREEGKLVEADLQAFQARRADLEAARAHLVDLLGKGEAAIQAWEATHLGLDLAARARSGASPLELLSKAVEAHHSAFGERHGSPAPSSSH